MRRSRVEVYGSVTYGGSTHAPCERPVFRPHFISSNACNTKPLLKLRQIVYDTYWFTVWILSWTIWIDLKRQRVFNGSLSQVPRNTVYPYLVGRGASHILNAFKYHTLIIHGTCNKNVAQLYWNRTHILEVTFLLLSKWHSRRPFRRHSACQLRTVHANARPWSHVGTLLGCDHGLAFACTVFSWVASCVSWNFDIKKTLKLVYK
jgi:hypothetical protein